eukprot:CAMPEP_0175737958 /NCGR_PEP_ID=MMETSP0097-20121207/54223_1 /TAXON_ID=311494 /ORGANISM="Alexandrium monilatum, Strain CCMP3105" /LENGTH=96 /DNA_ID=CAMNT_0017046139 /DNA_START=93 /DNA_END=381 /DNA_ORIENTATION=-
MPLFMNPGMARGVWRSPLPLFLPLPPCLPPMPLPNFALAALLVLSVLSLLLPLPLPLSFAGLLRPCALFVRMVPPLSFCSSCASISTNLKDHGAAG